MNRQDWAKEMADFKRLIAHHIQAGTCYLCQQPVTQDERRHGITGAHCDCANGLPHPAVQQRMAGVSLARMPGEAMLHIVDRSSGASRCGAGLTTGMQAKGTSWEWSEPSAPRYEICSKCVEISNDVPARN